MAGKDISEMSFEEFFGKRERPKERRDPPKPVAPVKKEPRQERPDGPIGFRHGKPRLNLKGSAITLYVPKYSGRKGSRYEAVLEQNGNKMALGNLKKSPLESEESTLPADIDILAVGADPLGQFFLYIDGEKAFEGYARDMLMFSAEGFQISRAEDTTIVLYRNGKHLWVENASISSEYEVAGYNVAIVEVGEGGYVRARDKAQKREEPKAAVKIVKAKPSAKIVLPDPLSYVSAISKGKTVPTYDSAPVISIDLKDVDREKCAIRIESMGRSDEVQAVGYTGKILEESIGDTTIDVVNDGKSLAKARIFIIPGFRSSCEGGGGIPKDPKLTVVISGKEYTRDIYTEDISGPYAFEGSKIKLDWKIPVIMVDMGGGMKPIDDAVIDVDSLPKSISISVKGASKKAVFLGGRGKKQPLSQDWNDETLVLDTGKMKEALFESPDREASLWITVNSCPVRQFVRVISEGGTEASYTYGEMRYTTKGPGEHVCRIYKIDKSVEERVLEPGTGRMQLPEEAVAAEVVEIRDGKEVNVIPLEVRPIPFVHKDAMGDIWLYTGKSKRIPVPDGLIVDGAPVLAEVRKWHSQIVRMNPELKGTTPERFVSAFKDAKL